MINWLSINHKAAFMRFFFVYLLHFYKTFSIVSLRAGISPLKRTGSTSNIWGVVGFLPARTINEGLT